MSEDNFFITEEGLTKDSINVVQSRMDVKKIS